jgi:hypothetical protein
MLAICEMERFSRPLQPVLPETKQAVSYLPSLFVHIVPMGCDRWIDKRRSDWPNGVIGILSWRFRLTFPKSACLRSFLCLFQGVFPC